MNQNKYIILIAGDPNSINTEIIFKSWSKCKDSIKKKIVIVGSFDLIKKQLKKLNYNIKMSKIKSLNEPHKRNVLKILNIDLKFKNPFKIKKEITSKYVLSCLNLAHKLALNKGILGIVNCAIDKKLLRKKNIGVTEYLAKKCEIKNNSEVMMISNKKLAVIPITTHIDLKNVSKNIKSQIIVNKVKTAHISFYNLFKRKPKIGILGLNPHNAELRSDSEENKKIIPAIKKLRKLDIKLKGPLVSDTVFINDYKNYDIIIGMFHDQVLAPFKSMFKFDAINITLGLKYLRVSPDHGTATNLILKKKANPTSLIQCINFISKFKK